MRCERVAQHVRMEMLRKTHRTRVCCHAQLHRSLSERLAAPAHEHRSLVGSSQARALIEPGPQCRNRGLADWHDALLAALTEHSNQTQVKLQILEPQRRELAESQTARIEQLH